MTTTLMTGSASGIGAATREALIAAGHTVIGIDLKNADIVGDLSTAAGRQAVIQAALERCGHKIDHLVLCAGLGAQTQPASLVTSVNFFGAVELLDGLLPALQKGSNPSAVVISSVASAMMPWDKNPMAAAFTAMDEQAVSQIVMGAGDRGGNLAYAGSKNAAEDVGFYYAANAAGRFAGTLLSGLLYQMAGIMGALVGAAVMLGLCWAITLLLPEGRGAYAKSA
jgi:NAD(P)-dependent dehydrogenase (short-subunit alcohol dehydrogenase family)